MRGSQYTIHKAICKYGAEAFTITVVCEVNSLSELDKAERISIAAFQAAGFHLYNMTGGGEGSGLPKSAAAKAKIAESVRAAHARNLRKASAETKRLMSLAAKRYTKRDPEHVRKAANAR